ncbi:hypothetical protein [Aphanothece sacrum]|uniref:Uncharacterized protein n=1 Tax=Aphanothece sacrum FPU1 TaxID=1920663 RepID=A0A401IK84_APHSA|nr:hypothetical protein [Aphanothece sacrum]GBF81634.1 hypothetical protein AsFPU1_3052 [Aphanothece sacrum FPU1]GBF84107.1 hypothetical protein AsFPU3_1153 [Aphanothece sacrum FPU3]
MTAIYKDPFERLEVFLNEYQPQLEKALNAIQIIKNTDPNSEEFSQAIADLHVCSTVLEPYSEGMVEAIDQFTEDRPD